MTIRGNINEQFHPQITPTLPKIVACHHRSIRVRTIVYILCVPRLSVSGMGRAGERTSEREHWPAWANKIANCFMSDWPRIPFHPTTETDRELKNARIEEGRSIAKVDPPQPASLPACPAGIPSHPTRPSSGHGDRERQQLLRPRRAFAR